MTLTQKMSRLFLENLKYQTLKLQFKITLWIITNMSYFEHVIKTYAMGHEMMCFPKDLSNVANSQSSTKHSGHMKVYKSG